MNEFNNRPHYDHDNGHNIRGGRGPVPPTSEQVGRLVAFKLKACLCWSCWCLRACACADYWPAECAIADSICLSAVADVFRFPIPSPALDLALASSFWTTARNRRGLSALLVTCSVEATCTPTSCLRVFCVLFFTRSTKMGEDTLANENEGFHVGHSIAVPQTSVT
jgi:hypothetical protein